MTRQRRNALALGLAGLALTAGASFAGALQLADVIAMPAGVAMIWVFPLVCAVYGIAKAIVSRRYA